MRFQRLDLNLLLALDALLGEQSVTRAAERLHMSQSAMSGILARLRRHFEDELLVQVGRKMVRTELGESLTDPIRDILRKIRDVADKRPAFDPLTSDRHFTVVASDYVIHVLMARVVRRVAETAPGVVASFELLQSTSDATSRERFESGEVDLVIVPEPYALDGYPRKVLGEEDYVCVAWSGSQIASQRLTLKRYLAGNHVIRLNPNATMPSYDEMYLRSVGHVRNVAAVAPSFILLPQLVIGTEFIATVHSRIARYYAEFLPIIVLPTPIRFPKVVEVMQWPSLRDRDLGAMWLRDLVEATVRDFDRP